MFDLEGLLYQADARPGEDPTKRPRWNDYSAARQLELLAQAWKLVSEGKVK